MKLNESPQTVIRSGQFTEQKFSIAASGKAFDILSSKIYTNVPLAIVRELSTNAYDSHVNAKCPTKPFLVHLPNPLESHFSIRDYGTGLSKEELQTVYTTYFVSTRTASDEYTGCLGLGSKSPFAYTDQFSVTSYYDGIKYSCVAFRNENGEPTLAFLGEEQSDEPNGLEVSLNIQAKDYSSFIDAANEVYEFFTTKPTIIGAQLTESVHSLLFEGANYKFFDEGKNYRLSIVVVMGQVGYNAKSLTNEFHNGKLVIFAKMGECAIAANREELHYNQKTTKFIETNVADALTSIVDQINKSINAGNSIFEKALLFDKYMNFVRLGENPHEIIHSNQHYRITFVSMNRRGGISLERVGRFSFNCREHVFIEEDVEVTNSYRSRLKLLLGDNPDNKSHMLVKITDLTEFQKVFGNITLVKLSKLPKLSTERNRQRGIVNRSVIRLLVPCEIKSKRWRVVDNFTTQDVCCVRRNGFNVTINNKLVNLYDVRNAADELGYKFVYGINAKDYQRAVAKLGMPDLETEINNRVNPIATTLSEYFWTRFHLNKNGLPPFMNENLSQLAHLSIECDDLSKIVSQNMSVLSYNLLTLSNFKIPEGSNFLEKFYQRYPLLTNLGEAKFEDIVEYIKLKEMSCAKNAKLLKKN